MINVFVRETARRRYWAPLAVLTLTLIGGVGCSRCGGPSESDDGPRALSEKELFDKALWTADYGAVKVGEVVDLLGANESSALKASTKERNSTERLIDYQIANLNAYREAVDRGYQTKLGLWGWPETSEMMMYWSHYRQKEWEPAFLREIASDAKLKAHYENSPELIRIRNRKRGRVIRFDRKPNDQGVALTMAHSVLADLNGGKIAFDEAARLYSDDSATASKGGETGWIVEPADRKKMTAYQQTFLGTPYQGGKHANSVFTTSNAYYLIQIEEERMGEKVPFEELRDTVERHYAAEHIDPFMESKIAAACERVGFRIHPFEKLLVQEIQRETFEEDSALIRNAKGETLLDLKTAETILGPMAEAKNPDAYANDLKRLCYGRCILELAKKDGLYQEDLKIAAEGGRIKRVVQAMATDVMNEKISARRVKDEEPRMYYEAHKEDFAIVDQATGEKVIPPYEDVVVSAVKANFMAINKKIYDEWFYEELFKKRNVKIDEKVRSRLVDYLMEYYR